ncbi:protein SPMIP2-like [Tubulanus polymorphus]|uniref:protein SPMIP2-like n=1 Tax=Tubulanus polymorphus TaxID=672921 RepID=UPI003DA30B71
MMNSQNSNPEDPAAGGPQEENQDEEQQWDRVSVYGTDRIGTGAMLFSGPDGLRNHVMKIESEHRYVGEGTMSSEGTSDVSYLWRAPRSQPAPRPKTAAVGSIGWGVPWLTDWSVPQTGNQIKLRDFRQECEQRYTHAYQNPWYPDPRSEEDTYRVGYGTNGFRCDLYDTDGRPNTARPSA